MGDQDARTNEVPEMRQQVPDSTAVDQATQARPHQDHVVRQVQEDDPAPGAVERCHCGQPIIYHHDQVQVPYPGRNGMVNTMPGPREMWTRGLCQDCDTVRCDAYPGACHDNGPQPGEEWVTISTGDFERARRGQGYTYTINGHTFHAAPADIDLDNDEDRQRIVEHLNTEQPVRVRDLFPTAQAARDYVADAFAVPRQLVGDHYYPDGSVMMCARCAYHTDQLNHDQLCEACVREDGEVWNHNDIAVLRDPALEQVHVERPNPFLRDPLVLHGTDQQMSEQINERLQRDVPPANAILWGHHSVAPIGVLHDNDQLRAVAAMTEYDWSVGAHAAGYTPTNDPLSVRVQEGHRWPSPDDPLDVGGPIMQIAVEGWVIPNGTQPAPGPGVA